MTTELNKTYKTILDNSSWEFPLNHAMLATRIIADFKGENLKIFDMTKGGVLCDYNVVATAQNTTQAKAMVDEIGRTFRKIEVKIQSVEGYGSADWILFDTGDIIVHIFQESTRDVYDLDHVFGERPLVKIPDEFYFGAATPVTKETDNLKGFF
jgi:ribosome-associated protein